MENTDNTDFVNVGHTRSGEQRKQYEQIERDGVCPFCPEHLFTYHKKPIVRESTYWYLTENDFPYEEGLVHYIVIHKEHVTTLGEVTVEARSELFDHVDWLTKELQLPGGVLFIRFGDTNYTGGSIDHLHAQFIFGGSSKDNGDEPFRIKIGYKKKTLPGGSK